MVGGETRETGIGKQRVGNNVHTMLKNSLSFENHKALNDIRGKKKRRMTWSELFFRDYILEVSLLEVLQAMLM